MRDEGNDLAESQSISEFVTVAKAGSIPEGKGATFVVNGRLVAVFFEKGEYHAIDDLCPHMGASLGAGEVCDGVVTCPWHAWRFSVCDGAWRDNPKLKIERYEVRVEGDALQVRVPAAGRRPMRDDSDSQTASQP